MAGAADVGRLVGMTQNIVDAPSLSDAPAPGPEQPGPERSGPDRSTTVPPSSAPSGGAPRPAAGPAHFTLRRSRTDRLLGGVCGGLAASLGADAALLRVLLVALTLITGGAAAVVYLAAWALAPQDDAPAG